MDPDENYPGLSLNDHIQRGGGNRLNWEIQKPTGVAWHYAEHRDFVVWLETKKENPSMMVEWRDYEMHGTFRNTAHAKKHAEILFREYRNHW